MLLINIHKLDIILAQPITLAALKHQIDNIWGIIRLEGQDILVLGASEHFHERAEIDAESDIAITAEGGEGFGFEHHGDESDVRIVHGLEGNAGVIAVKITILYQVFDSIDNLMDL